MNSITDILKVLETLQAQINNLKPVLELFPESFIKRLI